MRSALYTLSDVDEYSQDMKLKIHQSYPYYLGSMSDRNRLHVPGRKQQTLTKELDSKSASAYLPVYEGGGKK
jgi:hypothetical protein